MKSGFKVGGKFFVQCFGPDGKLKWEDEAKNIVTNEGLNHILNVVLHGETAKATWYVGLKNTGTPAAGDTMASHGTWTENDSYADSRKEYVEAESTSQSTTNSANKASFAISATVTIAGAFLTSEASADTGVLLCAADFTGGDKSADSGDTLEVQYSISAADA